MPSNQPTQAQREEITTLVRALEGAKKTIQEQDLRLTELTEKPLVYGVVVAVQTSSYPREAYKVGARVYMPGREKRFGRISRQIDSDGEVRVVFDDGEDRYCRVALGLEGPIMERPVVVPAGVVSDYLVVALDNRVIQVVKPEGVQVLPGQMVGLNPETLQMIRIADFNPAGEIAVVKYALGRTAEVTFQGAARVVHSGDFRPNPGDRVVLDSTGAVIMDNLGKEKDVFVFAQETRVTWDSIGGQEKAKTVLREAIELPRKQAALYRHYGKTAIKGVLLYGPPRCGKTMLGKATATAMAAINGRASGNFMYVKGPEVISKYLGDPEALVRQLFAQARQFRTDHGYSPVLFIDEADAILRKRGTGISSDFADTLVPMFLAEMDGLDETGPFVVLATNRPDILDPAVVGDGRIDRKVFVARPDPQVAKDIFGLYLRPVPLHNGYTHESLADLAVKELFDPKQVLYNVHLRGGQVVPFGLGQMVNGGMIAGIVDRATSIALKRDMERRTRTGLHREDIVTAIQEVRQENQDLNHDDALAEALGEQTHQVLEVRRIQAALPN